MKRRKVRGAIGFVGYVLAVCALMASLGSFVYGEVGAIRHREAEDLLRCFQEAMVSKLHGEVSQVDDLVAVLTASSGDAAGFPALAEEAIGREGVAYVAYVQDETMAYAFPEDTFGGTVGKDLSAFPYVYTLAKVTDDFVVEGPVSLDSGESAFLFIKPVNVDGAFVGEVAVGVSEPYVIEQLDLSSLEGYGYRYELWAVSPQDGSKNVIATSEGGSDFSHAAKSEFNMPTQWTLSIMPEEGWVPRDWTMFIVAGASATALSLIGLGGAIALRLRDRRRRIEEAARDRETGLLTYRALVDKLERDAGRAGDPLRWTIICLTVDDFEPTARTLGWEARRDYLERVHAGIDAVMEGAYEAARISGASFVIVVEGYMVRRALGDLMRALELALLWKVRIDGKKAFCMARSAAVRFPEDGSDPGALVERTVSLLERDRPDR
ncbi:GGDEF domain-containing protein [Eggerthella sp. BIOML-A1]|uniref:GGDEF domain-containing protein n=1 Tax=unclassified Eggerthella TaxID=2648737 RepID=UPI00136AC62D|nr:diguanylate cyclase [Eggerthella sp. BIOML-A3]MZJ99558.1 diguanylate cyclase [Eggerthella sp. BIOML-A1]MZK35962.1 diguanylate cyclase [Eggerthella sp. BIOML-A5]